MVGRRVDGKFGFVGQITATLFGTTTTNIEELTTTVCFPCNSTY